MRVSKSFKAHVEQLHIDIYNISLGFCTKRYWLKKTFPAFQELIFHFEAYTCLDPFPKKEIRELYTETSLFRVCLHFFLCKRSCDRTIDYCWMCSRVRDRNFQKGSVFDDMIMERIHDIDKLDLTNKMIDFDVYLSRWGNSIPKNDYGKCEWNDTILYAGDVFVLFVSILLRVHLNLFNNYFLNFPMALDHQKYMVRKIQAFVEDIVHMFWTTNINYFFVVFDKFKDLNRSVCFDIDQNKLLKGPYTYPESSQLPPVIREEYYEDYEL